MTGSPVRWHDETDQWYRSYRNERWEFDQNGLMRKRFISINDVPIAAKDRWLVDAQSIA